MSTNLTQLLPIRYAKNQRGMTKIKMADIASFRSHMVKKNWREGLNVCMNYEFNLSHHVGVVAKRLRAAADDNIYPAG